MKNRFKLCVFIVLSSLLLTVAYSTASASPALKYVFKDYAVAPDSTYYVKNKNPYIQAHLDESGSYGYTRDIYEPSFKTLMIDGIIVPQAVVLTENNRTLVPARIVSVALGANVLWDEATRSVTITKDSVNISMKENDKSASLNNNVVVLDVAVKIYNGVTYVPLRFITESLGGKAGYVVITQQTDMMDILPLPIVWIESKDFSTMAKVSDSEAINAIKTTISADISENYYPFIEREGRNFPAHFDTEHVHKLLIDRTTNTKVLDEFSCFVTAGAYSGNILFNKITKEIFVINQGESFVEIAPYNFDDYFYSFNLS